MNYSSSKAAVAPSVVRQKKPKVKVLQSTTITKQEKFGDFYVVIVTTVWSDGTETQSYFVK